MKCGVIIPAAGSGKRMGSKKNKLFLDLCGQPVIVHTLNKFLEKSFVQKIVIVVKENEKLYWQQELFKNYDLKKVQLVTGGKSRRESVFNGLKYFSQAPDYVIIHDGARPLLPESIIEDRLLPALSKFKAVSTGVPVKDTIKIKTKDNFVQKTPVRDKLVAIQTPQAFDFSLIYKAHQEVSGQSKISDDASLIEEIGYQVKIISGSYENIKITTPEDLEYAKMLFQRRGENC